MHPFIVLTLTFMESVYAMDTGPVSTQQEQQPSDLETLSQDPDTLIPRIHTDLFPIIENYKLAKLQMELNQAKKIEKIIELGEANKDFKSAPLTLNLIGVFYVNDEAVKKISHLFSNITVLLLKAKNLTNEGLKHLERLTNLKKLYLWGGLITDAGLVHLKGLAKLKQLILPMMKITDVGLMHLKSLTNLEQLILRRDNITDDALRDLKLALPKCEILTY